MKREERLKKREDEKRRQIDEKRRQIDEKIGGKELTEKPGSGKKVA